MEPTKPTDKIILDHYKKVAKNQGLHKNSTMQDPVIRDAEIDFFLKSIQKYGEDRGSFDFSLLDVGCGNGILLARIHEKFPEIILFGMEFSPDLLELALSRNLEKINFYQGDARQIESYPQKFEVIISERSIINILDQKAQKQALYNIADALVSGGMYFQSESYNEPLVHLNRARREMQLEEIIPSKHNRFLNEFNVLALRDHKKLIEVDSVLAKNYLSTHFFVSRIVHQVIRPTGGKVKHSHLVNFMVEGFGPGVGNYSPILFRSFQCLRKNLYR